MFYMSFGTKVCSRCGSFERQPKLRQPKRLCKVMACNAHLSHHLRSSESLIGVLRVIIYFLQVVSFYCEDKLQAKSPSFFDGILLYSCSSRTIRVWLCITCHFAQGTIAINRFFVDLWIKALATKRPLIAHCL